MKENRVRPQIMSLQGVRAIACLSIITYHCGIGKWGTWGVSVFFLLSGFLLVYNYYDVRLKTDIKSCILFSFNKIRKIYLLHIIMMNATLVLFCLRMGKKEVLINAELQLKQIIVNILLLQSWFLEEEIYFSLNGVSWFLSVYAFMCIMFPIILCIVRKAVKSKKTFSIILFVYFLQVIAGIISQYIQNNLLELGNFCKWFTYVFPVFRLGEFVIGSLVGGVFLEEKHKISDVCATSLELVIVGLVIVVQLVNKYDILNGRYEFFKYSLIHTPVVTGLIYIFALNCGKISKLLSCRLIVNVGNISAYMFLIHQVVIRYVDYFLIKTYGVCLETWTRLAFIIVVTLGVTQIYKVLERMYNKEVCNG